MNFIEVSDENEAVSGLENIKYYVVWRAITENFQKCSKHVSDTPNKMNLKLLY